ncbi:MAG: ABC transporter substrate-binding protein [Oscillospiraceae bacterium]|nr:ABC transporter substrate-binding protein [Oscillospiraceae bacterium]
MHKWFSVLLSLLLTAAVLCSCGEDENVVKGAGHSFSYTLVGNPDTLDPQLSESASADTVLCNLFEGLLTLDASGTIQYGVAESYEISDDQLHYKFHLRDDSYWYQANDKMGAFGQDACRNVTAADFVFAFHRLFDSAYHSPKAESFACIANGRKIINNELAVSQLGVAATDTYDLEFTLDYADAGFLTALTTTAAYPCNEEFFQSTKGRYGLDEQSIIGNGSFSIKLWLYDEYGQYNVIQMLRNQLNHRVRRIFPTDINFYIEKTDADAARIFTMGNADCYVSTQSALASRSEYHAEKAFSMTLGFIANPDSHFANSNILSVLSYTLDRNWIPGDSEGIQAAGGILPPAVTLLNKSCRELISDAGYHSYQPAEADRLYQKALRKLNISELEEGRVLVCAGMMDYEILRNLLDQWGYELDLHFQIDEVTESEYEAKLDAGDYDLALYPLTGNTHQASSILEEFLTDSHLHCSQEKKLRDILSRAASAPNLADCVELYRQAETVILEDHCFIPLFYKQRYLICKKGVEDVSFNPFSGQVQFSEAKYLDS